MKKRLENQNAYDINVGDTVHSFTDYDSDYNPDSKISYIEQHDDFGHKYYSIFTNKGDSHMKVNVEAITINGKEYVAKDSIVDDNMQAQKLDGKEYVIVRTVHAGVFAGYMETKTDTRVTLLSARRLWYWDGAASLSQLAMDGVSIPESCKFPCEVDSIELSEWIEIIPCTEKARLSIKEVSIWKS
jgi:hypothetical protein